MVKFLPAATAAAGLHLTFIIELLALAVVVWRTSTYLWWSGGSGLEDFCFILAVVVWNLMDISTNVQGASCKFWRTFALMVLRPLIKLG